uniref:Tetratricopeptide repeat protein n=2 Tax=Paracidobacterium acidisoli TaxID=2303751 RepID=A0A372INH9_9BACT
MAAQDSPAAGRKQIPFNQSSSVPEQPRPPRPPALIDPAGPAVSLQTSEAMFDIAVALNTCGYDKGLADSDPVRQQVRSTVNQAAQQSPLVQDDRDKLCAFIDQHRLASDSLDLAQYVSLGLYLTPPPELTPSVDNQDMPPDSTQVEEVLPLVRKFARDIDLHAIWVQFRPEYDAEVNSLHDPLTQMIVDTNVYLKMPASTSRGSRFVVVLEPMFSPAETNARVYGPDYLVVASPSQGKIRMQDVRHTYLHYEIEPLLYARASSMDRMLPILKTVTDAPIDFVYRSDIVSLVIECMIRAIEARTMDTGVAVVRVPAGLARSEADQYDQQRAVALEKIAAIRQARVNHDMVQGYVLTQYFYNQMIQFEHTPVSLKETIGEMVYGMDVDREVHRARDITFAQQGESDLVRRTPQQPRGLDLAEMKLMKGDAAGAGELAQKSLDDKTADPARAEFILARVDLLSNKMNDAVSAFQETIRLSKEPRMLAWAHIYLGRILDVQQDREAAVAEYKAALTVRDGQPDTKEAAEKGLKQPFELPHQAQSDDDDDSNAPSQPTSSSRPPAAQASPAAAPSPQRR